MNILDIIGNIIYFIIIIPIFIALIIFTGFSLYGAFGLQGQITSSIGLVIGLIMVIPKK